MKTTAYLKNPSVLVEVGDDGTRKIIAIGGVPVDSGGSSGGEYVIELSEEDAKDIFTRDFGDSYEIADIGNQLLPIVKLHFDDIINSNPTAVIIRGEYDDIVAELGTAHRIHELRLNVNRLAKTTASSIPFLEEYTLVLTYVSGVPVDGGNAIMSLYIVKGDNTFTEFSFTSLVEALDVNN